MSIETRKPSKKVDKSSQKWRLTPRQRSTIVVGFVLLLAALIVYAEIIHPNQRAKIYEKRLTSASQPLETCFERLAGTTQLDIYYAPDIPLVTKKQNVATIQDRIRTCRSELVKFDISAHSLPLLHLAGYTDNYRNARVNQRQAFDVIGQSNDVLDQYAGLADFLSKYYDHIATFLSYHEAVSRVDTAYISADEQQLLTGQAADLRRRAEAIRTTKAPVGFETTKTETTTMFVQAASGIDSLIAGYRQGNDYTISNAYAQIDQAMSAYDSTVVNLPFDQISKSYVAQQVDQLPVKVDNLLAGASE